MIGDDEACYVHDFEYVRIANEMKEFIGGLN